MNQQSQIGLMPNFSFTNTMPLNILLAYKTIMKHIAEKSMMIAVSIVKDRGVYNFSFLDAKGKELYRMVFFRGIGTIDKIVKYEKVALFPYSVKTEADLMGMRGEIEGCLSDMNKEPTLKHKIGMLLKHKL